MAATTGFELAPAAHDARGASVIVAANIITAQTAILVAVVRALQSLCRLPPARMRPAFIPAPLAAAPMHLPTA